ncbi:MAG TPA: 4Fe-4S binding protein [Firmicutes bacterium]|nr:4Fe-4S binding protein [Candidatus Fermentithermobacillaceae bacterium]
MRTLKTAREIPIGALITEAGNSKDYKTGDWRSMKPIWHEEGCVHCLMCWVFCPDVSIKVENGKMVGIDYDHCKGCGICARECPRKEKALEMVKE